MRLRSLTAGAMLFALVLAGTLTACDTDAPAPLRPTATPNPTIEASDPPPTPTADARRSDEFHRVWPELEGTGSVQELGLSRTVEGATVTVELAYADRHLVVLGLSAEGVEDPARVLSRSTSFDKLSLQTGTGETLSAFTGSWSYGAEDGSQAVLAFDASKSGFEDAEEVDLTLSLNLELSRSADSSSDEHVVGPFVLDFSLPVTSVPVVPDGPLAVDETVEADGFALSVEEIAFAAPHAFAPPHEVEVFMRVPQGFTEHEGDTAVLLESPNGHLHGSQLVPAHEEPERRPVHFGAYVPQFQGEWELRVYRLLPSSPRDPAQWTQEHQLGGPWIFQFEVPPPTPTPYSVSP